MKQKASRTISILILFLGIIGISATQTSYAAPNLINYQGSLSDSGGTPVPDGGYSMIFRIFDDAETNPAAILLWEESQNVTTVNGIYNVLLGGGTINPTYGTFDASLFPGDDCWLEVEVSGEVLAPRQQIVSVAYSLQTEEAAHAVSADTATTAGDADTVDGLHANDFAAPSHTHSGSDITSGTIDLQESTTGSIIKGINSGIGYGVFGSSGGTWAGVFGSNSNDMGSGVQGVNTALGYGVSGSSDGIGVYGSSKSTTGYGVYGISEGIGVYGRSNTNYAGYFDGDMKVKGDLNVDGKVGIGIAAPAQKLSVLGIIESTSGGFKFPDGTVQTTSLNAHAANPSAHHAKTTSASELTAGLLPNARISDSAIDTAKIADGAVTDAKIVDGAVSSAKMVLGSVGTAQIAAGAVTTAKLAPNLIQDLLGLEVLSTTVTVGSNGGGFTSAAPNIICSAGKTAIACGYSTEQNLWHVEAARPYQNKCNFAFTTCVYIQGGGFVCPFGQESVYLTATCVNDSAF